MAMGVYDALREALDEQENAITDLLIAVYEGLHGLTKETTIFPSWEDASDHVKMRWILSLLEGVAVSSGIVRGLLEAEHAAAAAS